MSEFKCIDAFIFCGKIISNFQYIFSQYKTLLVLQLRYNLKLFLKRNTFNKDIIDFRRGYDDVIDVINDYLELLNPNLIPNCLLN